jgi:beta-mannosidase
MVQHISLDGDWQFKDFYGEDWRWRNAHKPDTYDTRHWRTGTVPGSVHHDLWKLGEIPTPYYERNSLLLEWVPARTWIYKRTFFISEDLRGKRIQLRFEGVDYQAEFFLNGESLGSHTGMFTPALFEVSGQLQHGGDNLLAVVIEPAPHEQPQVGRTSKVHTHKSRMNYWWDFCPRMIHIGIWDQVALEATETVGIEDVFVRPWLTTDLERADISVLTTFDTTQPFNVVVEIMLRYGGEIVARQQTHHSLLAGQNTIEQVVVIEQPHLWWPNGQGEQALYEAEVIVWPSGDISDELSAALDRRQTRFGIRKIELMQNENADPGARPYTLVVNGRSVYIKGWNWVPIDVLYGVERPDKLDHLLSLAQRAHVNLLRVWGGGLIEKEAFYRHCDELGILVWQELIQSSSGIDNNPPETPEFVDMMVREAEQIIPRKRNHPSLAIWCGGNELTAAPEKPLDDSHPLLAALKNIIMRLDPGRLWLPTSPTGQVFSNSLDNIERDPSALHDVHGPWEYQGLTQHYELYNRGSSLLHSEFGVEGITNLNTLNATIAPENQWPATLDNPIWQHLGAWWNKQQMWKTVFGDMADIETLGRATQFIQAEGLRYALEADRRRQYHNSGTLPWQFNEPYPMAACTSAVDYYGQPKPAYYAVAQAYEPLHVSAKFSTLAWAGREQFEAEIWLNNSEETTFSALNLYVKIIGLHGYAHSSWTESFSCAGNSAKQIVTVKWPLAELADAIFFLDICLENSDEAILSHSRYLFTNTVNLEPLLSIPPTDLKVQKQDNGDEWVLTLTNAGDLTALCIWLADSRAVGSTGYAYFDTNHFCLFPQETRVVSILWRDVPSSERSLNVGGWNISLWRI